MSRYLKYGPGDKAPQALGDGGWLGVKMQLDPSQLPPGYASLAINMRFREGIPETREGSMVIAWMNRLTAGRVQPWGTVYGQGIFRDPIRAQEYTLIAANGDIWACLANNAPKQLSLPAGVTVTQACRFVQCFDVVILFRGFDFDRLVMRDLDTGFEVVSGAPAGTGTVPLPNAEVGVHGANRVFAGDHDVAWSSDILDYTHGSILDDFRINQGSADRLVQLAFFGADTLVGFKGRSVYRVDGVYGDLSQAHLSRVTSRYGCVAPDSVVDCGTDMLWLSQEGVSSLTLTVQNEIQAREGAVAGKQRKFDADIGPLIKRIHGRYASGATAALWNDRFYIALPIDQATVFGPELGGAQFYPASVNPPLRFVVTSGQTYRWVNGVNEVSLANGSQTLTSNGDFVAQTDLVTITGLEGSAPWTGSLRQVWVGTNTAIAVYDFQNAAWSGYDEAEGFGIKKLFISTYQNRERLFILTHDGYVKLYEESETDRLPVPYVDVVVSALPAVGNSIGVNGAAPGIVDGTTEFNDDEQWGTDGDLAIAKFTIWKDASGNGGFYPYSSAIDYWHAPDTAPVRITDGVRFYSTNGVLPLVTIAGDWATVSEHVEQQIVSTFVTRGYVAPGNDLSKYQFATFDLQTWNPSYTLSILGQGVNEETVITADPPETKDRTAYYEPFNLAAYLPSNINNDFGVPHREDYSIVPDSAAYQMWPGTGIRGDLHQESRDCRKVSLTGRAARLQLVNTQGRVRIMAAMLDTTKETTHPGVTA